jgi:hypothetical protein
MRRLLLALAFSTAFLPTVDAADLRDGIPGDVYLATWHQHNPERDYQRAHLEHVWRTIEETQIVEKFLTAIENQLDEEGRERFEQARQTLSERLAPIPWAALADCRESVYAQKMAIPSSQHLLIVRLPEGAAQGLLEGMANLIRLAEENANGEIQHVVETVDGMELHTLQLPAEVPFSATVGARDDLFLFASTRELAEQSLKLLDDPAAESKFDDPRFVEALAHLPAIEDGVTFFDGQAMFRQLQQYPAFIRQIGGGKEEAERVAGLVTAVLSEFDALDYEITVEYTEGYQNRSAALGRVRPDVGDKVFGKMLADQQPYEDWSRWVPADATSFSLNRGINLHPVYAWLMEFIPEKFPEAQPGLDHFAELQNAYDLHLDEDLLQAFSGESVSVGIGSQSVTFLKCDKPDRVNELLHRLVETLQNIPQLQSQKIALTEVEGLEGFEEISAGAFALAGARPVIGFHDGWLVLGSSAEFVQQLLETRAGNGQTFSETESFAKFNLQVAGPVLSIGYTNVGEQTRAISQGIQQFGAMLPMIMAMASQQNAEIDLSKAAEFFALLPSLGRIVGTLDFYEEQLTATQAGPDELSWTTQKVVLVRPESSAAPMP